jgi:hypothetical protein
MVNCPLRLELGVQRDILLEFVVLAKDSPSRTLLWAHILPNFIFDVIEQQGLLPHFLFNGLEGTDFLQSTQMHPTELILLTPDHLHLLIAEVQLLQQLPRPPQALPAVSAEDV